MDALNIRPLTQVETLVFEQVNPAAPDVSRLLRLLADYCEASNGCLLSVAYHNSDEGGEFRESLVAHIECPWQS